MKFELLATVLVSSAALISNANANFFDEGLTPISFDDMP